MRQQSAFALSVARPYIRWRLRRSFDGLFVSGLQAVAAMAEKGPLIVAANHVCWWDALTILALDEALGMRSHALMDAKNLAAMPFFGWVGALPLDRSSARGALKDMRSALDVVRGPRQCMWIFPQGEQRPAHLRPLSLNRGVHWLARKSGATVIPLSLNYLYRAAPEPTVVARFGAPLTPSAGDGAEWLSNLETALIDGLAECDRFVLYGTGTFEAVVPPRQSPGVPAAGRLLAAALGGDVKRSENNV